MLLGLSLEGRLLVVAFDQQMIVCELNPYPDTDVPAHAEVGQRSVYFGSVQHLLILPPSSQLKIHLFNTFIDPR